MNSPRQIVLLVSIGILGACSTQAPQVAPSQNRSVITSMELSEHQYGTVFEAVQALRGNWLRVKGTDSFNSPTQLWVYVDEMKLGGIETLKTLETRGVKEVRFIDGITASARWGMDHGQGVIRVATR